LAIGAVVAPLAGFQIPDSGQVSPVRAVVPSGFFMLIALHIKVNAQPHTLTKWWRVPYGSSRV